MIEQYVHWNEDIGEWQLKCVAYTGNNMRKQNPQNEKDKDKVRTYTVSIFRHTIICYEKSKCLRIFNFVILWGY